MSCGLVHAEHDNVTARVMNENFTWRTTVSGMDVPLNKLEKYVYELLKNIPEKNPIIF